MNRKELLTKSKELTIEWMDIQAKLDDYIQSWLNNESQMSVEDVQQLIDKSTEQINQLKSQVAQLQNEYRLLTQDEIMKKNVLINIKHNFDDIVTLLSNGDKSHLTGVVFLPEKIESEKENNQGGMKK